MKLAEALMERKDIIKQMKKTEEEILSMVYTSDKEQISNVSSTIIDSIDFFQTDLCDALERINIAIDKANEGIRKELKELQMYDKLISLYSAIRRELLSDSRVMMYREVPIRYRTITLTEINSLLESAEEERRNIDVKIQAYNWNTEIEW